MKKIFSLLFCCLMLCALLTGCDSDVPEESAIPTDDISVEGKITGEQVRIATGFAVEEPQVYADGSMSFYSADATQAAYMAAKAMTEQEFEELTASFADGGLTLTDAPNLGEKAYWCEEQLNLLVYADGVALDIRVEYGVVRANDSLIAARHIAALLLEQV